MSNIIGIDIGTTNIEYCYSNSQTGYKALYVERNPLSRYGLDVMTRITKANSGLLEEMSKILRESLRFRINELIHEYTKQLKPAQYTNSGCPLPPNAWTNSFVLIQHEIKIAANTTMIHILMNYDCTNLRFVQAEQIEAAITDVGGI